ncbi:DUF5706 domain-containing protein [Ferruginibacter paludis]|uniref:Pycsar system effector family protein n=1 Tax=Ferruginibacter paludis TaxID=1310417 RepID=UPI0025B2EB17|nr:Pycsar system effector family protein [Ferruginibacter paludis]MDN3656075.1 DUF5706 domain-containing protein [Ferruginibacter paludis]
MILSEISYHKAAGKFLKKYFEDAGGTSIFYSYGFISMLAIEAKHIAKSISLKGMDYQNAIVATWFRYAGVTDICLGRTETMYNILNSFFADINYPETEREVVEDAILNVIENKDAETEIHKVLADAVNSRLASHNFMEYILLISKEVNRLTGVERSELYYANYFLNIFLKSHYYTEYAKENYSVQREKNFQLLEKRIDKLNELEDDIERNNIKLKGNSSLTNKETEDLFKMAFRNYNHLVSVADSKASLLIHVNSIIISVMLAFVLGKIEKNVFLLWPAILLLSICMVTILLSILASRPQKNSFMQDQQCHSYQKFFFGSFDLIDPSFQDADWEKYYRQLNELFRNSRESVYLEIFKESFNVRKVLSKKFNYLSKAYWVFIVGLLVSVIAFLLAIKNQMVAL